MPSIVTARAVGIGCTLLVVAACGGGGGGGDGGKPPPADATIDVDATAVGKPISQRLFGSNIESDVDYTGLWDDANGRLSPAHVAGAQQAKLGVIRFPGGAYDCAYDWRDGVGPRASRPIGYSPFDRSSYANVVGTDEILGLCATLGAEPLFQVNLNDGLPAVAPSPQLPSGAPAIPAGTASEAAAWVSYCNATTRRATWWEMGNEQWIDGFENLDANEYVDHFKTFAAAMRAVDPGIKLGAVLSRPFGRYPGPKDADWDRIVLTGLAGRMDFVCVHDGYAPLVPLGPSGVGFWDVYRALLAFPRQVEGNLRDVGGELASYAGDGAGSIPIAVTEWSPWFDLLSTTSVWMDHSKTLGSAIFMTSMLNAFIRDPRVDMANQFKLADSVFIGLIAYDGTPKANLAAMAVIGAHHGDRAVAVTVDSPTFACVDVGVVAADAAVPCLDATATLSSDGTSLYLHVVNRDIDRDLSTRIRIAGFAPAASATQWRIDGPAIDANDGNDLVPSLPPHAAAITAPTGSAFAAGAPGTIAVRSTAIGDAAADRVWTFPHLTATTLELHRATRSAPTALASR